MSPVATRQAQTTTLQLYPAQANFLDSQAAIRAFVGGRGAGKTFVGSYDILRRAIPRRLYLAVDPTYTMLRDGAWRTFLLLGEQLHFVKAINRSDMRITLGNGAEVLFRSGDDADRLRGMNLSGAWLDEASIMDRAVYEVVIASLREASERGWLSATFTPKGRTHWTFDVFGQTAEDVHLVHATSRDNPFLPESFVDLVRSQYTSQLAEQELGGKFIDMGGGLFKSAWLPIVDAFPADCRKLRYWDFAATEAKAGNDPDYTAGVLLGFKDGIWYVLDVRHLRASPRTVEQQVLQSAQLDGKAVPIWIEQEPGSSGINVIDHYVRLLAGWNIHGDRVTGNKYERMQPLAAQAEAGNVRLLRGAWNGGYLEELASIPQGHDDQADATAGAFTKLQAARVPFGFIPDSKVVVR